MGSNVEFNVTLKKIIEDADRLSETQNIEEIMGPEEDEAIIDVENLPKKSTHRNVLGDIFHFMDRAKLPMHHEYKALFFRAMRAAVFIMMKSDVEDVKEVLSSKNGQTWEHKMAFDFSYIAARLRRRVPPPDILHNRVKAVYDFFKDKVDSKTGVALFHDKNKKNYEYVGHGEKRIRERSPKS